MAGSKNNGGDIHGVVKNGIALEKHMPLLLLRIDVFKLVISYKVLLNSNAIFYYPIHIFVTRVTFYQKILFC